MDSYSTVSGDYTMFDSKMELNEQRESPVDENDMMAYMFGVLKEYERCLSNGEDAKVNPMSGRVQMQLQDGSSVDVPEHIQRSAIAQFLEMKKNNVVAPQQVQLEESMPQRFINKVTPTTRKGKIVTVVAIVLLVVILYMLYKYIHKDEMDFDEFDF